MYLFIYKQCYTLKYIYIYMYVFKLKVDMCVYRFTEEYLLPKSYYINQ